MELSDWQLDADVPADSFTCAKAATAKHIQFARPDQIPSGLGPPPEAKPKPKAKSRPSKTQ